MNRLREYLSTRSTTDLAKEIGVSVGYLHNLKMGRRRPSLFVAAEIEKATGGAVPASAWASQYQREGCSSPSPRSAA